MLESLNLSDFDLNPNELETITHHDFKFLIIQKLNWNYSQALRFQEWAVDYVYQNKNMAILIFCSHPVVYTLGRGLQKLKEEEEYQLVEFDPTTRERIKDKLVEVKRGGGLTFHHPDQLVFYPIVKLSDFHLRVHDMMLEVLGLLQSQLEQDYFLSDLFINKGLLGLWKRTDYGNRKLASIGLAVSRFVTYHGMAFNLKKSPEVSFDLAHFYPCGLPFFAYGNLQDMLDATSEQKVEVDPASIFTQFKNRTLAYLCLKRMPGETTID